MPGQEILNFIELVGFAYLSLGLLFSIFFLTRGIQLVDSTSLHASVGFSLIVLPGVIFFWPFLLLRWKALKKSILVSPKISLNTSRKIQNPLMLFLLGLAFAICFASLWFRKPVVYSAPPSLQRTN